MTKAFGIPVITRCGNSLFRWGERTYIMGIINMSPDSFSGDFPGNLVAALDRAMEFVRFGADIIDIGGESTRPSSRPIDAEVETQRIVPFITAFKNSCPVPVSVDTYKFAVAKRAVEAGADMLNDISGLKLQPSLACLAAEHDMPIVLTSNERGTSPGDIVSAVMCNLRGQIERSLEAGVRLSSIIIDPGIGFGKSREQNMEILSRLNEFSVLGQPILIGTSRKSFITGTLDETDEAKLMGTAATVAVGIARGADIVRVHDVHQMALVCRMSDAIVRANI